MADGLCTLHSAASSDSCRFLLPSLHNWTSIRKTERANRGESLRLSEIRDSMRGLSDPIQITVGCWHVTVLQHKLYTYLGPKKQHQLLGSSWTQPRSGPFICYILRQAVRILAGHHRNFDLWFPPRRALVRKLSSQAIYVPSPTHP